MNKRKTIGALLTLLGIIFWLFVIATYRVWWVHPDNVFGLYQAIPFWFCLGVICLVSSIFLMLDCSSKFFFIFQFITLNIMIWATPVFIEPNARVTDSWNHFSFTYSIINNANLSFTDSYKYWPGSFVFSAMSIQISGMHFMSYLKYFPLFSSTMFIFGYYVIVSRAIKNTHILKIIMVLQITLNLWLQFHSSPQAFAIMLLPWVFLPIVLKSSKLWLIVSMVIIGTILISHPTTCIFIGSILFCIYSINLISEKRMRKIGIKDILKLGLMVLPLAVTVMITLQLIRLDFVEIMASIPNMVTTVFQRRISHLPSLIRTMTLLLFGTLGLLYLWFKRSDIKDSTKTRFCIGWLIGTSMIFLAALGLPGAHFHNRALIYIYFVLPILAIMGIFGLEKFKSIKQPLIMFLVILSLVNVASVFYVENEALISDSNLSSTEFIFNHAGNERVYAEQSATTIYGLVPNATVIALITRADIMERSILVFDDYALESNIVGPRTNFRYSIYHDVRYNDLIYSSGTFRIYLHYYTQSEQV